MVLYLESERLTPQFSGLPSAGPRGNPTMDRIGKTDLAERESPQAR